MSKRIGKRTIQFERPIAVRDSAAVVGKKEAEGPMGKWFHRALDDTTAGESTFEKAETAIQKETLGLLLERSGLGYTDIDVMIGGDLLNQCAASHFAHRNQDLPFFGIYGACSTMAESLALAAVLVDAGAAETAVAITSSHFCSAERQFRFPLEYGGVRTPTAQWTCTASGATLLGRDGPGPFITAICPGAIVDLGITDQNNMGAAMAPAAADTIAHYFEDTGTTAADFDLILTGDLAAIGSSLLCELLQREGVDISAKHNDCGLLMFDRERQNVRAGGSGCGCSAAIVNSYLFEKMRAGELRRALFIATGALLSPTTVQQKESIPCIAHLVEFVSQRSEG